MVIASGVFSYLSGTDLRKWLPDKADSRAF